MQRIFITCPLRQFWFVSKETNPTLDLFPETDGLISTLTSNVWIVSLYERKSTCIFIKHGITYIATKFLKQVMISTYYFPSVSCFHLTAFKACADIVFTYVNWLGKGSWMGGWWEIMCCLSCILETVRYRNFIIGQGPNHSDLEFEILSCIYQKL